MTRKQRIAVTITERNNNNNNNNENNKPLKWLSRQKQQVIRNTYFKTEVVYTIKITEILNYTFFCVIPYIHFPVMGFFPHIPMATMAAFPGIGLIAKNTNWTE